MKDKNVPVFDLIKNNTVVRIKERNVKETELDDYKNIKRDFKEVIDKLKKLRINIDNLVQFYDCDEIERRYLHTISDTMESINRCVKNLECLSFMNDVKLKYRPYKNTKEFFDDTGLSVGCPICVRANEMSPEFDFVIVAYTDEEVNLFYGGINTMNDLFSFYEIKTADGWRPLGKRISENNEG